MPQLKFAWWFLKFVISWVTLIILITIITKKSLTPTNISTLLPSTKKTKSNKWFWN